MKKIYLAVIAVLSVIPFASRAQWSGTSPGPIYYNDNNVGIGTSTPSSYFHGGNNKVIEISNSNTTMNSQAHVILSTGSTIDNSSAGTISWMSKNSSGFQGMAYISSALQGNATTNASARLTFATADGTSIYPRMTIDKDGKVGIGTDAPDELLSVKGIIHSQEVKVDMSGWSDYVFKPKYTLPSLSSVKSYIDKNQHLPEIPSEQDVIKNGLNLGEMNKLLLKKVEELTLYLIEKDKQLDEQRKRLEKVEARLNAKPNSTKH